MTQDIAEHLRKLSSRNGRYWLRDSRHAAVGTADGMPGSAEDLPFGSVRSKSQPRQDSRTPIHESVVVSIPNVASTSGVQATQQSVAQTKVKTPQPSLQQIPPAPHSFGRAQLKAQMPELAPVMTSQIAAAAPLAAQAVTATSALVSASQFPAIEAAEVNSQPAQVERVAAPPTPPASEPVPPVVSKPIEDDAVKAARATQSNGMESSISKIADEIVTNFPVPSSSVIMLSGSQSSLQADETCARVAAELASRNLGRVLLIDSDFKGRRLTKASGMSSQGGLSEIMNIAFPWKDAILKSGSSKLDFMASGSCPHKRWTPKRLLREALAEIRCEYQFVCVSAGDAHGSAAALWSELSDGALLVVSASQSSETIAQSAVGQMKANGARMLGCVVADTRD